MTTRHCREQTETVGAKPWSYESPDVYCGVMGPVPDTLASSVGV